MPEAGRQSGQPQRGIAHRLASTAPATNHATASGDIAGIFYSLSELYHILIECLENTLEKPADPQAVLRVVREQKRLLIEMEHAIETATSSGIEPQEIGAIVGRIDRLHRYCAQLMRRHTLDLEHTIAALQAKQGQCGAYRVQKRHAG